jgi:hypothetical protein
MRRKTEMPFPKSDWVRVSSAEGDIWQPKKKGMALTGEIMSFGWREKSAKEYKRNTLKGTHFPVCEVASLETGNIYSMRFDLIKLEKLGTFPVGTRVRIVYQGEKPIPGSKPMKLFDIDTKGKVTAGENWRDITPMPRKVHNAANAKKGKGRK